MDPAAAPPDAPRPGRAALPAGIWALGLGSMFMDISSELVHSLLPLFMTGVLGASMLTLGLVEGIAEAVASFTKVFSGALSDRLRRRKWIVVLGYGLSALSKPVFPLAASVAWVAGARFADRVGKGIRGAPRDALIADITPKPLRGAAYGLRQALDSAGACLGPLLALGLMALLADDIAGALWFAVVPALVAVALLAFGVQEPSRPAPPAGAPAARWAGAGRLPRRYWLVLALGAVFTLARFSEAFLLLRAQQLGLALGWVPLVMVVMNLVYAATAYPAGRAADAKGARALLLAGLVVLLAADLLLAGAARPATALLGAALWGLHLGLSQGLFAKLVADAAPAELRGGAFGFFHLAQGLALLLASVLAGWLWSALGAPATFLAGAAFALLALLGLLLHRTPALLLPERS